MNSNRDYQTQITNLQNEIKKLKEHLEKLENKNAALKIKVRAWEIHGKKLTKVIEIMKENPLCIVDVIRFNNYFTYREMYDGVVELTKSDFDLLKEVLCNE